MKDWYKEGIKNIWLPYTQMQDHPDQLRVKSTDKSKIILENGTELIDGISSWWSACHGYNNKYIIEKTTAQLQKMPHIMLAGIANKQAYKLASRLVKFTNKDNNNLLNKVFFSDYNYFI